MQARHATFSILRKIAFADAAIAPQRLQPWLRPAARSFRHSATRFHDHEQSSQTPSFTPQTKSKPHTPRPQASKEQPSYEMTFTCKPCSTRSSHRISKQGYHYGSVLITCPECKNRHIISDHLGIFVDKATTVEDLMRDKGQLVKKGTLSEDGDLEFWDDGTTTDRSKSGTESSGVA